MSHNLNAGFKPKITEIWQFHIMGFSIFYSRYVRYFVKKIIYEWRYKVILGVTPKMKRMHLHFAKVMDVSKILIFFIISHFKLFGALPIVSTIYDEIQQSACKFPNRVQKIVFHFSKKIRFVFKNTNDLFEKAYLWN